MATDEASNVLSLQWAFGFSRDAGVHNLCDENRSALFYASAHTGVIYDLNSKRQRLLQGHCNQISCTCASLDRRYIATADHRPESMLVLWDSYILHEFHPPLSNKRVLGRVSPSPSPARGWCPLSSLKMLVAFSHIAFTPRPATGLAARPSHRARVAAAPQLGLLDWAEDKIYYRLAKRRWDEQLARRPSRIILVRHGQSEGNVDDTIYSTVPDSQIALTERGFAQAVVAGLQIRKLVGNGSVRCFYSPYLRTKQTMLAILQAFDSQRVL